MEFTGSPSLSVTRGVVLYVGALLGPGLLLLPGLAAAKAGPASIVAWVALLVLSGLLAVVFGALGVAHPSASGVRRYAEAGLGRWAGRAVGWCFLAGIVTGAPVVCLIGGNYVAVLVGGGRWSAAAVAGVLLMVVVAATLGGVRASSTLQLALVVMLVVIVVVAVAGSAGHARAASWTPFAPHGWSSVGSAGAALMLSFVGWEAIAPLTVAFREPRRQLPRVIAVSFAVTAVIYLSLATVTVAALGTASATTVPLADLLTLAIGPAGTAVAAVAAVALTLGTTNAYLTGAAALAGALSTPVDRMTTPVGARRARAAGRAGAPPGWLLTAILVSGAVMIGATGTLDAADIVTVPTTFFLVVYLGCTAAACRLLHGATRVAAAGAVAAVLAILAFSGWALIPAAFLTIVALASGARGAPRERDGRHDPTTDEVRSLTWCASSTPAEPGGPGGPEDAGGRLIAHRHASTVDPGE